MVARSRSHFTHTLLHLDLEYQSKFTVNTKVNLHALYTSEGLGTLGSALKTVNKEKGASLMNHRDRARHILDLIGSTNPYRRQQANLDREYWIYQSGFLASYLAALMARDPGLSREFLQHIEKVSREDSDRKWQKNSGPGTPAQKP